MALDNQEVPLIVDTAHVEHVNSFGLRTWLLWISQLSKAARPIYFVRCAPSVVTQANYVANFLGSGIVLSFYAPYWCPKCGESVLELIELRDPTRDPLVPPFIRRCTSCDIPLELAELEEEYFGLVDRHASFAIRDDFWGLLTKILARLPDDVPRSTDAAAIDPTATEPT